MKIYQKSDNNGWTLLRREYANKCQVEIRLTELIEMWFDSTKNKSLDDLDQLLDDSGQRSFKKSKIIRRREPRGRYLTDPIYREFEITLSKPNRYPFIVISEPFK